MRTRRGRAAALVVLGGLVACGEPPEEGAAAPAGEEASAGEETPDDGPDHLVDSQATIPREPADAFADIATTAAAAEEVWQRFDLSGAVPSTDFSTSALVFVGLGESGSCPARFGGLDVRDAQVRAMVGVVTTEDGCTDDYNPRTFVVEASRDELPEGAFELILRDRTFVLSTEPLAQPPPSDTIVERLTTEATELDLVAEPGPVAVGDPVELVLSNRGEVHAMTGAGPMVLERWAEQRWLPVTDHPMWEEDHEAVAVGAAEVAPGAAGTMATVDTSGLGPGWYRVAAKLQLRGGRYGAVAVQGAFEVVDGP